MKEMNRRARLFADRDRLADGVRVRAVHGAGMIREDAAHLGRRLHDGREFFGAHVDVGHVAHPGRHAHRALAHRLANEFTHLIQFVPGRRTILVAHDVRPYTPGTHVGGDIDRYADFLHVVEELAEGFPFAEQLVRQLVLPPATERAHGFGLAVNLGREALQGKGRSMAPVEQAEGLRVAVHVDKAGRDVKTARVDRAGGVAVDFADRDDPVASNGDVGDHARGTAAVEDRAAANHEVVVGRFPGSAADGKTGSCQQQAQDSNGHIALQAGIIWRRPGFSPGQAARRVELTFLRTGWRPGRGNLPGDSGHHVFISQSSHDNQ